ncbi:probable aspartyl protease At4g16563 [Musa acuminata AAA Group]|uniref:probable aspartyl protease At4g16563 n=1 Tax=Musa acuminata AAA Group TaxID=214697 RepID=UPI0031DBA348
MSSSPPLLLLSLSFLLLLLLLPFSAISAPVTLQLSRHPLPSHPDPLHRLASLASASALRASLLKNRHRHASPRPSRSPLFPHSYGGYSLTLAFGTPPQQIPLLLDTGSHLTWVPCTSSYQCRRCSSPSATPITPFLPKSSASTRLVGCRNPRCLWIHSPDLLLSRCPACNSTSADGCPATACPPYAIIYGSGSTAGLLMLETLALPGRTVPDVTVGCSVFSERQPAGVAGFGRGAPSLPSQLGLKRFSYCLISRRYDDEAAESGSVVLDPAKEDSSDGLRFTTFLNNPAAGADEGSPFSVYYYIGLREMAVGGKKVRVPRSALAPSPSGDGGAIVDSGTTFTYMAPPVFEPVLAAFVDRVAHRYNRSADMEARTGLRPCFALPPDATEVDLPELTFRFKGGAEMRLPLENYFVFAGADRAAVCLTIVSDGDGAASSDVAGGPAIILGNFQQQDYYMVYDLEKGRLGFRRQSCLGS